MLVRWSLLVLLLGSLLLQSASAVSKEASPGHVGEKIEKKEKSIIHGHQRRQSAQEQPQNGTTTTASSDRPWLDPATASRFDNAQCREVRKWEEIAQSILSGAMPKSAFTTGGLGGLHTPEFGVWACFEDHACVSAVGGNSGDAMCYAFSEDQQSWYPWGLKSELKMCDH
jgi:hypothetical protein